MCLLLLNLNFREAYYALLHLHALTDYSSPTYPRALHTTQGIDEPQSGKA